MGGAFPHRSGANIQGSREKPAKRKVNCRAAAREAPLEGFKWESGIRRSAASGRNSEPDSRQGPGWQTQSVWEPEWPNGEQSKGAVRAFGRAGSEWSEVYDEQLHESKSGMHENESESTFFMENFPFCNKTA